MKTQSTALEAHGSKTKTCPYCAEEILAAAMKCKHCGEFMDGRGRMPCPSMNHLTCQHCGGSMKKATVSTGNYMGILFALLVFSTGVALCFFGPIGIAFGAIMILMSLGMGGKRRKVWKCKSCASVIERS